MNSFQGSERLIFEYIQHHAHDISTISAKAIARDTFTTTTSVNRVCKKWGIIVTLNYDTNFYAIS